MSSFLSLITSIILTVETLFSVIPLSNSAKYSPASEDVLLNCAVISDTHADSNPFRDRSNILRKAYSGIGACTHDINVLLLVGDITNSGSSQEYQNQIRFENTYIGQKHTVACMGNHDSWNGSDNPNFEVAKKLFFSYLDDRGIKTDKTYYSTVIDGYYFICIGTESLDIKGNPGSYSDAQVKWLDKQLTQAEKSKKPVFVLCHKPIKGHNGITKQYITKRISKVLDKHKNSKYPIFLFSGHCHRFTSDIFDKDGNIYYINLPSLEYNDEKPNACNENGGMGLTLEVYKKKVIINARNFIKNINPDGYNLTVNF